jgi:membrane protein DedA with SNARE-associated domain
MDFSSLIDIFLHLDKHLAAVVENYGVWVYVLLFAIIFVETGLVVMPFLPGDSLLFVAGTIAAIGGLDLGLLLVLLTVAAILGDALNYSVGGTSGRRSSAGRIRASSTGRLSTARMRSTRSMAASPSSSRASCPSSGPSRLSWPASPR